MGKDGALSPRKEASGDKSYGSVLDHDRSTPVFRVLDGDPSGGSRKLGYDPQPEGDVMM